MKSQDFKYLVLIITVFLVLISCDKKDSDNDTDFFGIDYAIYKFKGDYIGNVCVLMDKDKTRIVGYPSPTSNAGNPDKKPYSLRNDYYLDPCCHYGINSAYLEITKQEMMDALIQYNENGVDYPYTSEYMEQHILDKDPFLEYYIDTGSVIIKREPGFIYDTVLLNNIIVNGELDKYFKRIK
ncbi:hypothetical protein ACFLTE_11360 [Bacteroidota bacterium]